MTLLDTTDRPWREHLQVAVRAVGALEATVTDEAPMADAMPDLVSAVYHLARAVDGLVAAEPQISRWKPSEATEPAGNVPEEAGTSHLWPPRDGVSQR